MASDSRHFYSGHRIRSPRPGRRIGVFAVSSNVRRRSGTATGAFANLQALCPVNVTNVTCMWISLLTRPFAFLHVALKNVVHYNIVIFEEWRSSSWRLTFLQ